MNDCVLMFDLQAQALADPFAYDAYMEKRKQEKIEAERASRITVSSYFASSFCSS